MSSEHPDDNAQSRFTAFWMIVASFLVLIIVVLFVLCMNSSRESHAVNVVEDDRARDRMDELAKVVEAQNKRLNQAAVVDEAKNLVRIPVKDGMKLVLPALKGKQTEATKILVPGSPTQLLEAKAAAAAAKKKKDAEPKSKAPEKKEGDKKDAEASEKKQ